MLNQMFNQKQFFATALKGICLPALTMLALFPASLPTQAVTTSSKDYRLCAFQLLKAGIGEEDAAKACANALYPQHVSACVTQIERQTKLPAQDVLNTCGKARRPQELAQCVNGISQNLAEDDVKRAALDYCGRSLLPVRFASCVVGLRTEIKSEPVKTMDSCIDASDLVGNPEPSFIPAGQEQQQKFTPTFETQPAPEAQPAPETQTAPEAQPTPTPGNPQK
jgi:hypothetical protein